MRRHFLILFQLAVLWWASVALAQTMAQTLTTDAPAPEKAWEIVLKLAFPILMTAIGPLVTGFIKTWPPWSKYIVASLASMLVGAGAGAIPAFPLGVESAATIGATSGATGQALFNMTPKPPETQKGT